MAVYSSLLALQSWLLNLNKMYSNCVFISAPIPPMYLRLTTPEISLERHFKWEINKESLQDQIILKICSRDETSCWREEVMTPDEYGSFTDEFLITPPYGSYITYMLSVSNGVNSSRSNTLQYRNGKSIICVYQLWMRIGCWFQRANLCNFSPIGLHICSTLNTPWKVSHSKRRYSKLQRPLKKIFTLEKTCQKIFTFNSV